MRRDETIGHQGQVNGSPRDVRADPGGGGKNSNKSNLIFAFAPTNPTISNASQLLGISHRSDHEQTSWTEARSQSRLSLQLGAATGKITQIGRTVVTKYASPGIRNHDASLLLR
jgi:hypothetical protein